MSTVSEKLDEVIHRIAFAEVDRFPKPPPAESSEMLAKLKALGSELWIDTGDLEKARSVWRRELTALTTNNTLANQVVQTGVMDEVIRETVGKVRAVASDLPENELVMEIGFVINCKIALRLIEAFRVKVSVELHPAVSRDVDRTLHYARRYFKVCPEYFIIKVPLTPEGLLSVRKLRAEGMPINFTLGFSARQNYLAARLSNPSYVNVFLGRLNAVVSDNQLGSGDLVGEKVTLATQRALNELRQNHPETTTRLIGASVRNGDQVAYLAGLDVLTIPPAAMQQFLDTGRSPGEIKNHIEENIKPGINPGSPQDARFAKLWEVPDSFKSFVDSLMEQGNLDRMSGEKLVAFCRDQGVDLFYDFSPQDLKKIYDHGKIPRLNDWPDEVALDNLMTCSALQSFSKDQDALDNRIRSFLTRAGG